MTRGKLIGLATLASGLALGATAILFAVGDDQEGDRVRGCSPANSSLPVVGARLASDGRSVRLAYAGAEPCHFAVDRYKGRLYVELRTNTDLEDVDRRPPLPSGCADGIMRAPVPPSTPVERISGNKRLLADDEVEALLSPDAECEQVAQGQPAFIID